jgi:hypothetical protein
MSGANGSLSIGGVLHHIRSAWQISWSPVRFIVMWRETNRVVPIQCAQLVEFNRALRLDDGQR